MTKRSSDYKVGDKVGRLTIEKIYIRRRPIMHGKLAGKKWDVSQVAYCRCDCGNYCEVKLTHLRTGFVKSCGCLRNEICRRVNTTHGLSKKNRIYHIWTDMNDRCRNPNKQNYQYYGGRGIRVCDEWRTDSDKNAFLNFYTWSLDHGYNDKLSIDRIDNNGPYAPWNCRWITHLEQMQNMRRNKFINDGTDCLTYADFCRKYNIQYKNFMSYIQRGWSLDAIVYKAKHPQLKLHRRDGYYRDKEGFVVLIPKIQGG